MKDKLYKTTNLYLAAYLLTQEQSLKRARLLQGRKFEFEFETSPTFEELIEGYFLAKSEVNAHSFVQSIKQLKDVIHSM